MRAACLLAVLLCACENRPATWPSDAESPPPAVAEPDAGCPMPPGCEVLAPYTARPVCCDCATTCTVCTIAPPVCEGVPGACTAADCAAIGFEDIRAP